MTQYLALIRDSLRSVFEMAIARTKLRVHDCRIARRRRRSSLISLADRYAAFVSARCLCELFTDDRTQSARYVSTSVNRYLTTHAQLLRLAVHDVFGSLGEDQLVEGTDVCPEYGQEVR